MKLRVMKSLDEEQVAAELFSDIQKQVELILEMKFYPLFQTTDSYQKCMIETDWDVDDIEAGRDDDGSSTASSEIAQSVESLPALLQEADNNDEGVDCGGKDVSVPTVGSDTSTGEVDIVKLEAEVLDAGICHDSGRQYGMYAIQVKKYVADSEPEVWVVPRRYSDFHDLHLILKETCHVTDVSLPGKKAFNRLNLRFLNKRKQQLNDYLQVILDSEFQAVHVGAADVIVNFLSRGEYSKAKRDLVHRVESIVNPLLRSVRSMSQTIKAVPGKLDSGMDSASCAPKAATSPSQPRRQTAPEIVDNEEDLKLRTSLLDNEDTDDNIPLRILLLLMDEVFDLKTRFSVFLSCCVLSCPPYSLKGFLSIHATCSKYSGTESL
jgi:sorting nexin-13